MTSASRFDVAVVGGGPAGSAAAFSAADAGCTVVLPERARGDRRSLGESLPPVAGRLLRQVFGADRALDASTHAASYGSRAAWGSDALVSNDFVLDPEGRGWRLDRARFDTSLRDIAIGRGVEVRTATEVRSLTSMPDGWALDVTGDDAVEAGVVIDATGRPAVAARATGARRRPVDRLVAAVAYYSPVGDAAADVDATTLVEAVELGWWYTSRLPDGRRVVVFLTDGDLLDGHSYRTGDTWSTGLRATRHVGGLVEGYGMSDSPTLVAADTAVLDPVFGTRWLATGDAAISFDPLSSLGILTAIDFGAAAGSAAVALLDANTGPAADYATRVTSHFNAYLAERERVNAEERRWPTSPFWERRAALGRLSDSDRARGRLRTGR
jgi:flavin-dependent dehydrogenase